MPLHFPAQGDSSKCQESCSMWLLESHHVLTKVSDAHGLLAESVNEGYEQISLLLADAYLGDRGQVM